MTLEEIKAAVDAGKKVHWANAGYEVRKSADGEYFIIFTSNQSVIGLTWSDGITMNGDEKDFFIADMDEDYKLLNELDPRLVTTSDRVEQAITDVLHPASDTKNKPY